MRRSTAALSVVAAAMLLVFAAWLLMPERKAADAFTAQPPPLVETAPASVQTIELVEESVGSVEAAESIIVTAPVTGTVARLYFIEGARVKAGAPLVTLKAKAEQAALEAAKAELRDASNQWRRLSRLAGSGAVSRSALDEARNRLETARARVDEGRAAINDRIITAPFAGTVGLAQVSPGAVVEPGDPITSLATLARLKISFRLPAQTLPRLRPGLPIRASIAGIERRLSGSITRIDNAVDPATRTIALEAGVSATGGIKPGMFVNVELVLERREAVVVPEAAVVLEGEQAYVYQVGPDGLAVRNPVTLGERRDGVTEVRKGLAAGARIVTAGLQKIVPGQPVSLREASSQGAMP